MRKMSRALIGAIALPVGLLPATSWAATTAPTDAPATSAPAPSTTATGTPTDVPPGADPLSGTFKHTPAAGPAGTVITLSSVTPCVDAKGVAGRSVDVVLFDMKAIDGAPDAPPAAEKIVSANQDGSWTAAVATPKTAKNGDTYLVIAGCFSGDPASAPSADPATEPFLVYEVELFMVVDAPAAPVAAPVTKAPSFTG